MSERFVGGDGAAGPVEGAWLAGDGTQGAARGAGQLLAKRLSLLFQEGGQGPFG